MPRCLDCLDCQNMLASAEVRRLPANRWRCKDPARCEARREKAARQLSLLVEEPR